jgi:RNA polymerase sigma-70 factor (ECF subfamily)
MGSVVTSTRDDSVEELERYRIELTAYCYRMLGSGSEAEDAVQETLTRAWRAFGDFEGRAAVRTWLYKIASNVCFDLLKASQRRALPMDMGGPSTVEGPLGPRLAEPTWVMPVPDGRVLSARDPEELAVARESIRLAFVAALQYLPPRQRAVLILREVLRWEASEVAALLETSVASVNSALQRARATLAAKDLSPADASAAALPTADRKLLQRYVEAFERYDIGLLTALLHEDAQQQMPPYELWLSGREEILKWWFGPGIGCKGSKLLPTAANGEPAFGQYRKSPEGGYEAWSLQTFRTDGERVVEMTFFLDVGHVFPYFGLPLRLHG